MSEQTEAGPQVPPPVGATRKPTAKETADQALEGVLALQARLAEWEAGGVQVPVGDAAPADLVKQVTDLDRDLTALAEHVNNLPARSAAPNTHLEESLRALAEQVRRMEESPLPELGAEVISKTDALAEHVNQELGSLGRAVSTLTERLAELDARPQAAEDGEDGTTARMNALLRSVDVAMRDQREDAQRNLGALNRKVDELASAFTIYQQRGPAQFGESVELTVPVPKVFGAMVDVMRKVREVGKNGTGPREAGSYGYRKLDDAVDAVGAALREVGILLVPVEVVSHEIHQTVVPTKEGSRTWTTATVTMRWRYIHPEDGSSQDVVMAGEGRDMGDKATGKANSNAWKNALVQSLNIPVQGMPEVEDEHPVIGAGQGPAEQRPSAPAPMQPQGGQLTKDEAARRTVQALNNLGSVPPAERRAKLDAIAGYASEQGLTDLVVDGVKVSQVIITVLATLVPDHAFSAPPGQRGPIANTPQRVMDRAEAQVHASQAAQVHQMIQERDPGSTAAQVSGMVAQQAQQRASQFDPQAASEGRSGWTDPQPQQFPLGDPTDMGSRGWTGADEPAWEGRGVARESHWDGGDFSHPSEAGDFN